MSDYLDKEIHRCRKALKNPYAYLGPDDGYEAILPTQEPEVHRVRRQLEDPYAFLDGNGEYGVYSQGQSDGATPKINVNGLLDGLVRGARLRKAEIEKIVRKLQAELWIRRAEFLPDASDVGPIDLLDPRIALEALGFRVNVQESLGGFSADGQAFVVAGTIEHAEAEVQISRRFAPEIRRFTMAHELAHAILHEGTGLHRDRALDGAQEQQSRDRKETEADNFAAFFLMPSKPLAAEFKQRFLTQSFALDEATAFALNAGGFEALHDRCRSLRDLTRILASAKQFDGKHFHSLSDAFGVSAEAMAIRLEEVGLVRF